MTMLPQKRGAANGCNRNVSTKDERVRRTDTFEPITSLTMVAALRMLFRYVFYDDPFDLINNLVAMDDSVEQNDISKVAHYRGKHTDPRFYCLKPYTRPPPPPPSFFSKLFGAWRSSMLRLVLWRLLVLDGVATGWWMLLYFWTAAREVVDDFSVMYSFFSLVFFLVLPQYLSIAMDKYYLANEKFSLALSYMGDMARYTRSVAFGMDERPAIFVQERTINNYASTGANVNHTTEMKLTPENTPRIVSFSIREANGAVSDVFFSPVDALVHFQYILHSLPYAIVDEFRGVFSYERLPLLPMQKYMLSTMNPHAYDEIDTLLTELSSAVILLQNSLILRTNGGDATSLNGLINQISEVTTVALASTTKSIPPAFSQLLDVSTLIFCMFLPPVFFMADTWWLQYLLYNIIVFFVYGIVRLAQEFRHQLQTKNTNPFAAVPVDIQADRKAAFIDSTMEAAIGLYLSNQNMLELETNAHYKVNDLGELLLNSPGLFPSSSTSTIHNPPPKHHSHSRHTVPSSISQRPSVSPPSTIAV